MILWKRDGKEWRGKVGQMELFRIGPSIVFPKCKYVLKSDLPHTPLYTGANTVAKLKVRAGTLLTQWLELTGLHEKETKA